MNLVALALLFCGSSIVSALWAFMALDTLWTAAPGRNFALAYVVIFAIVAAASFLAFVAEYIEEKSYRKEAARLNLHNQSRNQSSY